MRLVKGDALRKAYRAMARQAMERGDLTSAYRTLRTALKDGLNHKDLDRQVINDLHDVAATYCAYQNYAEAENIYRLVLAAREKVLGEYHPDTAESLELLSTLLSSKGQKHEAIALAYRAFALRVQAVPA